MRTLLVIPAAVGALLGCGGRVSTEDSDYPWPTEDSDTKDASSWETGGPEGAPADAGDGTVDVDVDGAGDDVAWDAVQDTNVLTCDNLPSVGFSACCAGKPCIGQCWPSAEECNCGSVKGGCPTGTACCSAGLCTALAHCQW